MKHLFGPVNSRRLGRSLGVDLFVEKICNLNCIYCEVGPTVRFTCQRDEYVPTAEILREIDAYCADPEKLAEVDVMTVTASGEPTLHSGFGAVLAHLQACSGKPVAVLTNGTTLHLEEVRREISSADIVIPSLDAAVERSFRRVDRPAPQVDLAEIVDGLKLFSHQFQGQLWLEVLLVAGFNDSDDDIDALCSTMAEMRIDRLQLNTVARPPLEPFARAVAEDRLRAIARHLHTELQLPVDLLTQPQETEKPDQPGKLEKVDHAGAEQDTLLEDILQMVRRRPCTAADINRTFHLGGHQVVEQLLAPLVRRGKLRIQKHGNRTYFH